MARGRKPSVRYWPSRKGGGYFCTLEGRQVELALGPDDAPSGETYLAALNKFTKLLALEHNKGTNDYLVSALMNQYRVHMRETLARDRIYTWEAMCRSFAAKYGSLRVRDLRGFHFDDWLREQEGWNPTTKNHAGRLVQVAINWAVKKGYIDSNPVYRKVDLPQPIRRGREARMTPELCRLLIENTVTPEFRRVLTALHQTGARPAEILKAEAFNFRRRHDKGLLIFHWNAKQGYVHKTAKRTRKDRLICFTPEMTAVIADLAEKNPHGPLFRTPTGKPWKSTNIAAHWKRLLAAPAVAGHLALHGIDPQTLVLYNFRHTWISDWIDSGRSVKICADLCGTSVRMIDLTYGHADEGRLHDHYLAFMSDYQSSK